MLAPSHTIALDWADGPSLTSVPLAPPMDCHESQSAISSSCRAVASRLLDNSPEYQYETQQSNGASGELSDLLFAGGDQPQAPSDLFKQLRWGGLCLFASPHWKQVVEATDQFKQSGFVIERAPVHVRQGWRIPFLSPSVHGFLARKVELLPPGETTSRFTYDVHLARHSDPQEPVVVEKQIPTLEAVIERLRK